jgi:NADH dehydrogenase [ubiquinone] 1 alpha subcomplex assembly factor 7
VTQPAAVRPPADVVRAAIARQGPVPWSTLVEEALYGPGGFYTSGGGAGRHRDFLTSPELGGMFGVLVGRAVDAAWMDAGRPDPWFVIEAGAGAGTLARAVLAGAPACSSALRYVAVEISPALRTAAASRLPVEDPSQLLGPRVVNRAEDPDAAPASRTGIGPLVTVLQELPAGPVDGVVIANELLDNLPFDVYEWSPGGWAEVRVGWSESGARFTEVGVPAEVAVARALDALVPRPVPGARVPWQGRAAAWVSAAMAVVEGGRVVSFDYARPTADLAGLPQAAWMRTYRGGGRGSSPLDALGQQDLTVDVAVDQLPPPSRVERQTDWLARHGSAEVAAAASAEWRERRAIGDLAALRAQSVVHELAALTDPDGLGGFTVCEWGASAAARAR